VALIPASPNLRKLAAATFTNTVGSGLWATASAVFLTRSAGLTPGQVGFGFSVGGVVGLCSAVPVGSLADRFDPRTVRACLQVIQAAVAVGYVFVHSLPAFLLVVVLGTAAMTGNLAVRASLVAAVGGPDGRMAAFATLRAVASLGLGAGAGLAALALAADTRPAYVALVLTDAATYVLSALLLLRLPRFPPPPRRAGTRRAGALRDRPFLAVTIATSLLSTHTIVLSLAVPIWIVTFTSAPPVLVSALVLTNMAMTVLLAVRFSRGTDTAPRAAAMLRRSGLVLGLALVLFSLTAHRGTGVTVALLLLATVVYTVGDLLCGNASTGLSYALSRPDRLGQYQGVSTLGTGVAAAVGPLGLTVALLGGTRVGWWLIGLCFAAVGAVIPALAAWASAHRAETVETGQSTVDA
jgi:MFS family permease